MNTTWARKLYAVAAMALLGLSVGCESNGLLDPTAVGRFKQDALVVPVLNNLDRMVEEPRDEFLNATEVRPEDLKTSNADYVISRNDLLNISISDLVGPGVETVKSTRVSESGNISLPLIGPVKALGQTEAGLERAITQAYREANIIQNAQVSVTVQEARGRTFSILGAVMQPGQYAIVQSDFRVLDALVLARDTSTPQAEELYVIRPLNAEAATTQPAAAESPAARPAANGPGDDDDLAPRSNMTAAPATAAAAEPTTAAADTEGMSVMVDGRPVAVDTAATTRPAEANVSAAVTATTTHPTTKPFEFNDLAQPADRRVIHVPLAQLRNGDLRYNIVIQPNDLVLVPQPTIGEYYMGGHVVRVGVYSLTGRKITLKQAVISAGMFDPIAIPERTEVIRRIGTNREVFVRVNLDKIFNGQQPDVYLKPNDVVQVGTNALAPFLAAVRGAFRVTYGFGFLYDRNFAYDNNDQSR